MKLANHGILTISCGCLGTLATQQLPQAPLGEGAPYHHHHHEPPKPPKVPPPTDMELHALSVTGRREERINLAFFSDGYTLREREKFVRDAQRLTAGIVDAGGALAHVRDLINVWGVFVPSEESGLGQDHALWGSPFGLYRSGHEFRAVYVEHVDVARSACAYWRDEAEDGGCDQPILLGNDELYGGLGGEFTIITSSPLNGPLVLQHELGHSLIDVGEEYEGGYAYFGANSDNVENLQNLKWAKHLSDPENVRIEDTKVPLQAYPWHNLDNGPYSIPFTPSLPPNGEAEGYPSALLRISLSSIPYANHIRVSLGPTTIDLAPAFPLGDWKGSKDRRWIEIPLNGGIAGVINHGGGAAWRGAGSEVDDGVTDEELDHVDRSAEIGGTIAVHDSATSNSLSFRASTPLALQTLNLTVALTRKGYQAKAGRSGKMVTSVEIVEYGGGGRCNTTHGFVGAFPTYDVNGNVTLRPMNEECLMRRVNYPTFCPVCAEALRSALEDKLIMRMLEKELSIRTPLLALDLETPLFN